MDIREIRRKNLTLLREEAGTVRALADRVDTDPNYLSQILGGHGRYHMGHRMARRFELALKKPEGWMDQPHDEESNNDHEAAEIAQMIVALPMVQRESIKSLVRSMVEVPTARVQIQAHPPAVGARSFTPPPPPTQ